MPALPDVPGVARAVVGFTLPDGHHTLTRHYYKFSGTMPAGDAATMATGVYNAYATQWATAGVCDSAATVDFCTVEDLTSPTSVAFTYTHSTACTGNANFDPALAVLLKWNLLRRYRGGHPRTYVPAPSSAEISGDNTWNASVVTAAGNLVTGIITTVPGLAYGTITAVSLANVSYYNGFTNITKPSGRETSRPTLRAVPVVDVVNSGNVLTTLHSQRRRRIAS